MSFNKEEIGRILFVSIQETFAEMAFIDVIPESGDHTKISYSSIIGISFSEPGKGSLLFYLPKECKKKLVENIYGEEWVTLSDMEIDDCLLEMLNVLAGDFLKNLYGKDKKNVMSFPKLIFDDESLISEEGVTEMDYFFNAEGAKFKAQVSLIG